MQNSLEKILPDIDEVLLNLTVNSINGRAVSPGDRSHALKQYAQTGMMRSLEPLLPLILSLNQQPFSLVDHKPFSQAFRTMPPRSVTITAGRQLGKSQQLAALGVARANAIKGIKQLFVTPLYEQIRRFSNNYVRPLINHSPVRTRWMGTTTENSVLQRSFKNLSLMIFSFALLDADRIRGVSADCLGIDEVQDFDPELLSVVRETISASVNWGLESYSGTAKTTDSLLHRLFGQSSQAEWFIPCFSPGCRTWNIPSKEYHIVDMIGPMRADISRTNPGVVCHKCRKPIMPDAGHWVHKYPQKRWTAAGYHMPQIIFPLHFAYPHKWNELLMKQQGWSNTTPAKFWNEVLGESFDAGQKLVTETELRNAARLPWANNTHEPDPAIFKRLKHYKHRLLAIDWGGGGEDGVSFTALAVLGYSEDGQIDVLWGTRLHLGSDHIAEAKECMRWYKRFGCDFVAHDFTGAGEIRETVMIQNRFDPDRIFGIRLVRAGFQNMMVYHGPTAINHHQYYSLDKTRSLLWTCNAIRLGRVQFFAWDQDGDTGTGLIEDFLALVEHKTETHGGSNIYTIRRNAMFPDDFAQAVNIGCAALWHVNDSWPKFGKLALASRMNNQDLRAAGHADFGWENDSAQNRRSFMGLP